MKAHTKQVLLRFEKAVGGDPQWFEKLQRIVHLADALLPLFKDAFQSRQRMIELIDGLDPKDPQFPFVLEALDGLPRFGRHFVNELSLVARKNTPAARSGRPRIPADKEKAVVDFIQDRQLRFYAETLSENQRKAAIKYKISPRTARRIWERRFTPHLTGEDITQFFVTHFATLLSQTEADQLKLSADPQVKQTATDLSLPAKP